MEVKRPSVKPIFQCRFGHELETPALGRFYKRNGYKGKVKEGDLCFWLELNDEIVAAARLITDISEAKNLLLLRGLWVHKELRKKNLGSQLLHHISTHTECTGKDLYCLTEPYLERFYNLNQFQKIDTYQIPNQILTMQQRYIRQGQDIITMALFEPKAQT